MYERTYGLKPLNFKSPYVTAAWALGTVGCFGTLLVLDLEYMRNATSQSHSKYDTSKLRSQSVVRPSTERKRPCCRGHCYPQEKLYPSSVCFLG